MTGAGGLGYNGRLATELATTPHIDPHVFP